MSAPGASGPAPPPVVVTGAGGGIGRAICRQLVARGARVVAVGRAPARLRAVAEALGVESHAVDLADLEDVRHLAATLRARHPRIRALVSNAGVLTGVPVLTVDGNEPNMQVNALAPMLLATMLAPALVGGRLITTGSRSHRFARLAPEDLESPGRPGRSGASRYAASKRAAAVLTHEFGRRHPAVATTVVDPGVVATRLWRHSGIAGRVLSVPIPGLVRTPARAARGFVEVILGEEPPPAHLGAGRLWREDPAVRDPAVGAALWKAAL
ncbi:MAG: SDR family NAD(P)-dependent oxidoreductase, partial [Miltoncostaeaceae bacterium]